MEGQDLTIYTDHQPLKYAFSKATDPLSNRQQRHVLFISQFTTKIQHISGKANVVADSLSRIGSIVPTLTPQLIQEAQLKDPELSMVRTSLTALKWQDVELAPGIRVLCDVSCSRVRPWVPSAVRRDLFRAFHGTGHLGSQASRRLLSKYYVWHGLARDVNQWVRECERCQRSKIQRHTKSPHTHMDIPSQRFSGARYVMTIIDRFSRWPEAFPIADITAETCARTLLSGWVARFGLPDTIISDRGSQFTSTIWERLSHFLGFQLNYTTAYHPQSNGMVERLHRQIKESLRTREAECDWVRHLPWVLLGIRTSPKDDSGFSPAQLVFGTTLRVPGVMCDTGGDSKPPSQVFREMSESLKTYVPLPTSFHGQQSSFIPSKLFSCPHVWLRVDKMRNSLTPPYEGPFEVIHRKKKTFVICINGRNKH